MTPNVRADLKYCQFDVDELESVNLSRAELEGIDLAHFDLSDVDFHAAWLTDAKCSSSRFNDVSFRYAELSRVDFRSSSLRNVDFTGADLLENDFSDATLIQTSFVDVDLSSCCGLDSVTFLNRCYVDIFTIVKSWPLPRAFIEGCGLPDEVINYLPSLIGSLNPLQFFSCFISYSHANRAFALRLHDSLQKCGIRCWLDEKQILPGDDIYAEVDRGLKTHDKLLLCASTESLNSPWVEREIDQAIEREMELKKQRGHSVLSIIPLNLDGSLFEWDHPHAHTLKKRLALDFTDDGELDYNEKFDKQVKSLVGALNADDMGEEKAPIPQL